MLNTNIQSLPANNNFSESELLPASMHKFDANSVKYPIPTIFNIDEKRLLFIPVFSANAQTVLITKENELMQKTKIKQEPTMLTKIANSGFIGLIMT